LDIDVSLKHTGCVVRKFLPSGKHLTFWSLNVVTGHPRHGLPSCQFSAS